MQIIRNIHVFKLLQMFLLKVNYFIILIFYFRLKTQFFVLFVFVQTKSYFEQLYKQIHLQIFFTSTFQRPMIDRWRAHLDYLLQRGRRSRAAMTCRHALHLMYFNAFYIIRAHCFYLLRSKLSIVAVTHAYLTLPRFIYFI